MRMLQLISIAATIALGCTWSWSAQIDIEKLLDPTYLDHEFNQDWKSLGEPEKRNVADNLIDSYFQTNDWRARARLGVFLKSMSADLPSIPKELTKRLSDPSESVRRIAIATFETMPITAEAISPIVKSLDDEDLVVRQSASYVVMNRMRDLKDGFGEIVAAIGGLTAESKVTVIRMLGSKRNWVQPTKPLFTELVKSTHPVVRVEAVRLLGERPIDEQSVGVLIGVTDDSSFSVRLAAIQALGNAPTAQNRIAEHLRPYLSGSDPEIRSAAAASLAKNKVEAKRLVRSFGQALESSGLEVESSVVIPLLDAISNDPTFAASIRPFLSSAEPELRCHALEQLKGKKEDAARIVPGVIPLLRDPAGCRFFEGDLISSVGDLSNEVLDSFGSSAVPPLLESFEHPWKIVHANAADYLKKHYPQDPQLGRKLQGTSRGKLFVKGKEELIAAIGSGDRTNRDAVVMALQNGVFEATMLDALAQTLREGSINQQRWAARGLGRMIDKERASTALLSAIQDPNLQILILDLFSHVKPLPSPIEKTLRSFLKSEKPARQLYALRSAKWTESEAVLPDILNLLLSNDTRVVTAAMFAVDGFKNQNPLIRDRLISALNSPVAEIRETAIRVLPNHADAETIRSHAVKLLKDPDSGVRSRAGWVLHGLGKAAEPAIPAMIDAITVDSVGHTLAMLGDPAVEGLKPLLADPSPIIRSHAIQILTNVRTPSAQALVEEIELERKIDSAKQQRGYELERAEEQRQMKSARWRGWRRAYTDFIATNSFAYMLPLFSFSLLFLAALHIYLGVRLLARRPFLSQSPHLFSMTLAIVTGLGGLAETLSFLALRQATWWKSPYFLGAVGLFSICALLARRVIGRRSLRIFNVTPQEAAQWIQSALRETGVAWEANGSDYSLPGHRALIKTNADIKAGAVQVNIEGAPSILRKGFISLLGRSVASGSRKHLNIRALASVLVTALFLLVGLVFLNVLYGSFRFVLVRFPYPPL